MTAKGQILVTNAPAWAVIALSLASAGPSAAAQPTVEGWPGGCCRVGPAETAAIGGLAVSALLLELVVKPPSTPRWVGPILFDQAARSALRASSAAGRSRAAIVSDIGYLGVPLYAIGVESGLVTWLGKGKADAALQLALIHAEALAVNALLFRLTQKGVGRVRPDAQAGTTDNTAFFSGHTSTAFTTASVLCVQHSRLRIYGDAADQLVCPAAVTVAAVTGLFRIVADRHWASDVIAGAVAGTVLGAGVAWIHLGAESRTSPSLAPGGDGRSLVYGGAF
jgi:membrane-associated phospholipid phosphatase